jgi:hypothetical protein
MAAWPYAVILGGAVVALNARRMRTWQSWVKISVGIEIWLLISAPALDMWFVDPLTSSRTARVATFAHGVSLDSLRVFAMNYLAHFRWSYLVSTGDPKPGVTWRYLNGFGAFYWFVIPLTALGLACASPYVRAKWTVAWLWIWLLAYPLGGALTNDGGGAPNAPRTLAGVPVFCVLAAIGLGFLMDRSRKIVLAAFGIASAVAIALFAGYYFTRYVHVNSNAWDSGTRAMFSDIRAHAYAYDRVCFFVHPAWYGIDSYVRFYLDDVPIQTIEDADDPACYLPGTMLVTDTDHADARPGFVKIASVPDVDGATFAVIRGRPRL